VSGAALRGVYNINIPADKNTQRRSSLCLFCLPLLLLPVVPGHVIYLLFLEGTRDMRPSHGLTLCAHAVVLLETGKS